MGYAAAVQGICTAVQGACTVANTVSANTGKQPAAPANPPAGTNPPAATPDPNGAIAFELARSGGNPPPSGTP